VPLDTFEKLPDAKRHSILDSGIEEFSRHSYLEANTDRIVAACGISKGSLYHYFGSKKGFYLYLLEEALRRSLEETDRGPVGNDPASIVLSALTDRLRRSGAYPAGTAFLNQAAKERCEEVGAEVRMVLGAAMGRAKEVTRRTLSAALDTIRLREGIDRDFALRALSLYVDAITMDFLERFREEPARIFAEEDRLRAELGAYLELMIRGLEPGGRK
jgi:AcrR family transcriptional regulator